MDNKELDLYLDVKPYHLITLLVGLFAFSSGITSGIVRDYEGGLDINSCLILGAGMFVIDYLYGPRYKSFKQFYEVIKWALDGSGGGDENFTFGHFLTSPRHIKFGQIIISIIILPFIIFPAFFVNDFYRMDAHRHFLIREGIPLNGMIIKKFRTETKNFLKVKYQTDTKLPTQDKEFAVNSAGYTKYSVGQVVAMRLSQDGLEVILADIFPGERGYSISFLFFFLVPVAFLWAGLKVFLNTLRA